MYFAEADFSLNACKRSVEMFVKDGADPFEELGRSVIRAEQDPFFNKRMIEAWKEYINEHNLTWNRI